MKYFAIDLIFGSLNQNTKNYLGNYFWHHQPWKWLDTNKVGWSEVHPGIFFLFVDESIVLVVSWALNALIPSAKMDQIRQNVKWKYDWLAETRSNSEIQWNMIYNYNLGIEWKKMNMLTESVEKHREKSGYKSLKSKSANNMQRAEKAWMGWILNG